MRGQRGGGIGRKVEWGVIGKAAVLGGDVTCSSSQKFIDVFLPKSAEGHFKA